MTKKSIVLSIPLKTISEANAYEHWTVKKKRRDHQKLVIKSELMKLKETPSLPCHVKLTRIGKRILDSDNLPTSMKWARDCIADHILPGLRPGMADNNPGFTWEYDQQIGKSYSIIIELNF